MTTLLYLMACPMSPAPLIYLAESRVSPGSRKKAFVVLGAVARGGRHQMAYTHHENRGGLRWKRLSG
jgi:hypothetical protein